MTEIFPFIGTRFNSQLIGTLDKVVCPPYDVINSELQQQLYDVHENNAVRLEMPMDVVDDDDFSNKFTKATNTFGTWRSDGVLIEDERPTFYVCEQEYFDSKGEKKSRLGFFAKVRLNESGKNTTKMYQSTTESSLKDRYRLLNALKANVSPIWAAYNDDDGTVESALNKRPQEKPWEEIQDADDCSHRLWVVQKKEFILSLIDLFKEKDLFLLDGHHRYRSAMEYRDSMREQTGKKDGRQPFDYVMMYLAPFSDDLSFQQFHRGFSKAFVAEFTMQDVIEELEDYFEIQRSKIDLKQLAENQGSAIVNDLTISHEDRPGFVILTATGGLLKLNLRGDVDANELVYDDMDDNVRSADSTILHNYVVNQVMVGNPEYELPEDDCWYFSDPDELVRKIADKKILMGVFLKPLDQNRIRGTFGLDSLLPAKTVSVLPKPITGLVMRNLQSDQKKNKKP